MRNDPRALPVEDARQLLDLVLGAFPQRKTLSDGSYMVPCPFHSDSTPSLKIGIAEGERGAFICFGCQEKGNLLQLAERVGIVVNWLPDERKRAEENARSGKGKIVATYDYPDETGELLYQVVRFQPKRFAQRRPAPGNPNEWVWNLQGVRRVIYRLPEIQKFGPEDRVFVVEGEKDADRLWSMGIPATTNAGGASKWDASFADHLAGFSVVIIPDNDAPGRKHAHEIALSLVGVAKSIAIVDLPGVGEKGDVSDWFDSGHSASELFGLVLAAPAFSPTEPEVVAPVSPASEEPEAGPPHDPDGERALLSAAMLDANALDIIRDSVEDRTFYIVAHRYIWRAILLAAETEDTSPEAVIALLKRETTLSVAGGESAIHSLAALPYSPDTLDRTIKRVGDLAIRRRLTVLADRLGARCRSEAGDITEVVDWTEKNLFAIGYRRRDPDVVPLTSAMDEAFDWYESVAGSPDGVTGLRSGWRRLDRMTAGFQRGELAIVAARPGMGKTMFLLNLLLRAGLADGVPVILFSLEMRRPAIAARLVCLDADIDSMAWRSGSLTAGQKQAAKESRVRLAACPISIDARSGLTLREIRAKTRMAVAKHGIGAVMIDYLQLIRPEERLDTRSQDVGAIAVGLKRMALDLDLPVIAAAQVRRDAERHAGSIPQLGDIRESGDVEQEADAVVFIHRPDYYGEKSDDGGRPMKGIAKIIVAKQRNGPTGTAHLRWFAHCGRFANLTAEEAELEAPG